MKICLIGYGKMGKAIEEIALKRGHQISGRIGKSNFDQFKESLRHSDVAIEFTIPEVAFENLRTCSEMKVPVVSGTTGWLERFSELETIIKNNDSSLVYASNFSIGVQLFFYLNKQLAILMAKQREYSCSMEEIHHKQKLDAPSGTALHLAKDILKLNLNYTNWELGTETNNDILAINALREDGVVGTHTIRYKSAIDEITICHKAFSREGFALGAVIAAEWICSKKGIFTMSDVLGLD